MTGRSLLNNINFLKEHTLIQRENTKRKLFIVYVQLPIW